MVRRNVRSQRGRVKSQPKAGFSAGEPPSSSEADTLSEMPEWLEEVRIRAEREAPLMQTLIRRSIMGASSFSNLSEESIVNATAAPTNLATLV
jgi:hypothetical protein